MVPVKDLQNNYTKSIRLVKIHFKTKLHPPEINKENTKYFILTATI